MEIDTRSLEQLKLEAVQKRLIKWRLSGNRLHDITCPVCGHRNKTFYITDDGREITGRCRNCGVAGKIDSVELSPEQEQVFEQYKTEVNYLDALRTQLQELEDTIKDQKEKVLKLSSILYRRR